MDPDEAAYHEAQDRHSQAAQTPILMSPIVDERRGIDAHESDEGAEIERFGADFIGAAAQSSGK